MQSTTLNNNFKIQNNGPKVGQLLIENSSITTSDSSTPSKINNLPSTAHCSQSLISSSSEVIQSTDFTLIKSSVTKYHSVKLDLDSTRTVHCLDNLSCLVPVNLPSSCQGVHHGQCSPIVKLNFSKPVATYPLVTSPPSQSDYAVLSCPSNQIFTTPEADKLVPPEIPPRTCNHLNHKSPLEILSSHQLPNCNNQRDQLQSIDLKQVLTADKAFQDQLQQLLLEFVQEEKMRQESKNMSKKSPNAFSLADRRSLSMSSLNSPSISQQPVNYGPTDYYIRGRSSHNSSPKESINRPNHNFLFNLFNRSFSIPNTSSSQVNPIRKPVVQQQQQQSQMVERSLSPSVTRKTLSSPVQKQAASDRIESKTSPSGHVLKLGNKMNEQQACGKPMDYGISEKSPKGKCIDMANSRVGLNNPQVPARNLSSKSLTRSNSEQLTTTTSNNIEPGTSSQQQHAQTTESIFVESGPSGDVVAKKKVKRSNSLEEKGTRKKDGVSKKVINVMSNPFEQVLNEVLQLTDDEKACILASHQQSLNQTLKQQRKADFVQQQQSKLQQSSKKSSSGQSGGKNHSPFTNLNKQKSFSSDSLSSKKLLVDFDSMMNNPTAINYSNPIDYARTRFINSFVNSNNSAKNPALPSFIDFNYPALKQPTQQLVNEVKTKWELPKKNNNATNNSQPTQPPKEKSLNKHNSSQRRLLNLNDPAKNPVKPFLSRGSVAERVLLFEKCPEVKSTRVLRDHRKNKSHVLYNTWRGSYFNDNDNQNDNATEKIPRELVRRKSRTAGTNCKNSFTPGDESIPRFHFPNGRPYTSLEIEEKIKKIKGEFEKLPAKCIISKLEMTRITKACDVPLYWKEPIRLAVLAYRNQNQNTNGSNQNASSSNLNVTENSNQSSSDTKISCTEFLDYWKKLLGSSYEESCRFVKILTKGERNYLIHDDFIPMIQDVVESHPGLLFLKDAIEFHSRYVHTVIARIFYCVNKSWSGKITIPELRKSNFLSVVAALELEDDINQITDYFSYEHFYVIYCKFWELDKDHDLIIDKHDLSKHNDGTISVRMIDRIYSGAVTRGPVHKYGKMTYTEFVWFLIAEEDKRHPRSIEYWFRCMDLDGDGYLSMYELEFFYSEQVRRMDAMGIEALPFNDALCQMLDMVSPDNPDKISLADLKRCRMTPVFFDTFFNLDKYLDHEQRDPFANTKNEEEMSDWDKFAAEEYELLVAEENVGQPSGKGVRSNSLM